MVQNFCSWTIDQRPLIEADSETRERCPVSTPMSCSLEDTSTCCFEGKNGLFVLAQLWDYVHVLGPSDAWTMHGLWPDLCDGNYRTYCHNWPVHDVSQTLKEQGLAELLDEMHKYWKSSTMSDERMWKYEFDKHATCMDTLDPVCYNANASGYQYVGNYFSAAMRLWRQFPTYENLKHAGISPSDSETHTVHDFINALRATAEYEETGEGSLGIYLACDRSNSLTEIRYFFHLKGSVPEGKFFPAESPHISTCRDGFRWRPKVRSYIENV